MSGLSFVEHDGPKAEYSFAELDYLDIAHLAVTVNGAAATATLDPVKKVAVVTSAVPAGATVRIVRTTPRLEAQRQVPWSTVPFPPSAAQLNTAHRQTMLVAAEAQDQLDPDLSDGQEGIHKGAGGHWDSVSKRLEAVADAVNPGDALTKNQLDIAAAGARNLPVVTGADNDSGLAVFAGEWATRTPSQMRTHFGLGTVATLNSGSGASQVPVFDGSARYPAIDGRNIDLTNHPISLIPPLRARSTIVHLARNSFSCPVIAGSTWSESTTSRVSFQSPGSATRTELDAGASEVDDNFTGASAKLLLAAGTWRIEFVIKAINTTGGGTDVVYDMRWTDGVNSSSQVIYYDLGSPFLFSLAGNQKPTVFRDTLVVSSGSAFDLCYRNRTTSAIVTVQKITLLIHKVSSSSSYA